MKKCRFCAEDIQDDAVFCRYCHNKIKGIRLRRIVKVIIILTIAVYVAMHVADVKRTASNMQIFFRDLGKVWSIFKETLLDVKNGVNVLKGNQVQVM